MVRLFFLTILILTASLGVAGRLAAEFPQAGRAGPLPNKQGQLWHSYDISPYTSRITSTTEPQQAIVEWILRQTGYAAWHTEPLAVLSATKNRLRVYHTPAMHERVSKGFYSFV